MKPRHSPDVKPSTMEIIAEKPQETLDDPLDDLRRWTESQSCWNWKEQNLKNKRKITMTAEINYTVRENEIECSRQQLLFVLIIIYSEESGFEYRINPQGLDVELRNDDVIRLINGMEITNWDPRYTGPLLRHLVCDKRRFQLNLDRKSTFDDEIVIYDAVFEWNQTGYMCTLKEVFGGRDFRKDLNMISDPHPCNCLLVHCKTDLCITTDGGRQISFVTKPDEDHRHFSTIALQYRGDETDGLSRHCGERMQVYGFKLSTKGSDVTYCLGVTDSKTVELMESHIPDHGKTTPLKTKSDSRFFYCKHLQDFKIFESTKIERHYLAVNSDDPRHPSLYLKEISADLSDQELFDQEDIKFEVITLQ